MSLDLLFAAAPTILSVCGIVIAAYYFLNPTARAEKHSEKLGGFYRAAYRKFYIDELYLFFTKKVIFNLVARPAAWIDKNIVDGMMNGFAYLTATTSNMIKGIQSGKVQSYALYFFAGIARLKEKAHVSSRSACPF